MAVISIELAAAEIPVQPVLGAVVRDVQIDAPVAVEVVREHAQALAVRIGESRLFRLVLERAVAEIHPEAILVAWEAIRVTVAAPAG